MLILVILFEVIISFSVLTITFISVDTVKYNNKTIENIVGVYGLIGILLVGTGMYIGGGGGQSLKEYYYISIITQLVILGLVIVLNRMSKKAGRQKLISICSLSLVTISFIMYVYYIIASFIYY
ncbi:hypothetical protein CEQ21_24240 [Niallia circulans]|uniref:Uncharacterized protein n=1 Tax=Niallia circulans TaxID=1397 RepID=A0A553SND2_NIACI|nr:hypothetical protein [Niallia circulans]TRZ38500.1 hypothetical protein CEQ21_24240 [Niallia circulans]